MLEKLRRTTLFYGVMAGLTVLSFVFTDLFYYSFANANNFGFVACSILVIVCFGLMILLCCNIRRNTLKYTLILSITYAVLLGLVLFLVPYAFHGTGSSYFVSARNSVFIVLGVEFIGYVLMAIDLQKTLKRKQLYAIIAIFLAVVIVSVSCWCGLDNSIIDGAKSETWALDAPSYDYGKLSKVYNAGSKLKDDYHGESGEESYLQVASHTNIDEFNSYLTKLVSEGYTLDSENVIENIIAKTYIKDGRILHLYYNKKSKTTRIVTDPVSTPISEFSYSYQINDNDNTKIYQYSLMYDDNCLPNYSFNGGIERCGMNYIIKLADNKLIIIDGGAEEQSSDVAVEGFYNLCKQLTGSDHINIACWFCTHAHGDHIDLFSKFLRVYSQNITLERYMFNFRKRATSSAYELFRRLEKYAPDALYIKPHTGECINLANVKIEVIYTHEDAFDYHTSKSNITDFNDSSTVLRFTIGNKRFMLLGDMNMVAQETVYNNYSAETLKTDILQAAHHGYNNLDKLYPIFDADYVFYPQGTDNALGEHKGCNYNYNVLKKYTPEEHIYLINKFTYGLNIDSNGNITEEEPIPYIGPDYLNGEYYDGSGI